VNLEKTLLLLQDNLAHIGEELLLAKEPDELATDIDTFITNRRRYTSKYLRHSASVPVLYTNSTRGFSYYLSDAGLIKPIDLFDAPFILDKTIAWFSTRARPSLFNQNIKVLSQEDQAAHLIYKTLKKEQYKVARFEKILRLTTKIECEAVALAVTGICREQKESKEFTDRALRASNLFYSRNPNSESFCRITRSHSLHTRSLFWRAAEKIKQISKSESISIYLLKRNSKTRGPIVCCVGVDGSGKSTTVQELCTSASKITCVNQRMEVKTKSHFALRVMMRIFLPLMHRCSRLCGKLKLSRFSRVFALIAERAYVFFIHFDTKYKIECYLSEATKGNMVIVDRWWSDFFVAPKNRELLERNPAMLTKFLSLAKPDLFVLMQVPTEVSVKRRPEDAQFTLAEKKSNLSKFMAHHFSDRVIEIDGQGAIRENIKVIHKRIYSDWMASH